MSDEGFHEIQLNGKQLVFLFMAATVVAVVIFLCGVMVGRGVPTRTSTPIHSPEQAALDPTASLGLPATQTVATSENAPLTAQETLTYPSLLEDPNPPVETLAALDDARAAPSASRGAPPPEPPLVTTPRAEAPGPAVAPPPPKPALAAAPKPVAAAPKPVVAAPRPAPPPAPKPEPVAAAGGALAEPAGTGFVVQVAAVRQRAEANTIARRLSGKGYPAFVTTSGANFRVRVGKFNDRREAESVAGRLEREEQFKPWITR
jgi:cell division septation protein DedD